MGTTSEDDHRNSKKTGGSGWMWFFVIGIMICGVVGLVVFQKKQEAKKHRFYSLMKMEGFNLFYAESVIYNPFLSNCVFIDSMNLIFRIIFSEASSPLYSSV